MTKQKQILLMARPTNFKICKPDKNGEHVNEFAKKGYLEYSKNPKAFKRKAHKQWRTLKELLQKLGAKVIEIRSNNPNDDMVFTADPSLSLNSKAGELITIFSRFSNKRRENEVATHAKYFEAKHQSVIAMQSHFRTEGTGDNIYDPFRDIFWSGYANDPSSGKPAAGRSDIRAHKALTRFTGVDVVSLNVKKPFFHIDTSLGLLTRGHILCYQDGMQPKSFNRMKRMAFKKFNLNERDYLIKVSQQDANKFACNVRCIGNTVIIPECSDKLKNMIKAKGYKVESVDLSCFIAAGGAVHCLTNNINELRP